MLSRLRSRLVRRVDPGSVRPDETARTPARIEGPLRVGYVVWDWPALSQTFVINEIRELIGRGHDVVVYFHVVADEVTTLDFEVEAHHVANQAELRDLVVEHDRQVLHSPFAYPAATRFVWPTAKATGIPFTFMAGGVDVAHYENMKRNKVGKVASSPHCLGVITLGSFHRDLLLECGVPSRRIVMERQSAALPAFSIRSGTNERPLLVTVGRLIEKKGLEYLVRAAARMPEVDVRIHGYGPLEPSLQQLAAELGATNVDFAGPVSSGAELERVYREADLFVLPCVRAEDGDLDGLPTVLLEAMAAGLPVVTTDAANIPDLVVDGVTGFLCRQREVSSLIDGINRALDLPPARRLALSRSAAAVARVYANPQRTVDTLVRLWRRESLDVVLVTYDAAGHRNEADTREIIRRIYRFTTLPVSVTVVDNASDRAFVQSIVRGFGRRQGFRLVPLRSNVFCGPASNIGFGLGRSPWLVYVCSKEGFVLRHGWEHQLIRTLESTGAAIAGQPVELAAHATGRTIQDYPSFAEWRARDFAAEHPDRRFRHVQGGLFMVRRDVFEQVGGFNEKVPQNGMDVEFSYYLESQGHELATAAGVIGISAKTRPALPSLLDEHTSAVHPSSADTVDVLDGVVDHLLNLCPVCEWHGYAFDLTTGEELCPECSSSAFSRSAARLLSQSGQLQRRPRTTVLAREDSLRRLLGRLSTELDVRVVDDEEVADALEALRGRPPELLVLDRYWPTVKELDAVAGTIAELAANGTQVVLGAPVDDEDEPESVLDALREGDAPAQVVRLVSGACVFDPFPVVLLGFPYDDLALQGIG